MATTAIAATPASSRGNIAGDPLAADECHQWNPHRHRRLRRYRRDGYEPTTLASCAKPLVRAESLSTRSAGLFGFPRGDQAECPIHDASAVAYLLRPDLYRTEAAVVRVATEGIAIGQTIHDSTRRVFATNDWVDFPTCDICIGVNAPAVLKLYLSTLSE